MMVQGHTVHTFLSTEYFNYNLLPYLIWDSIRGITAPVFMFSSGAVFTYLLVKDQGNERIKKGFIRFIMLVTIGYLLRYPTFTIFYFGDVTLEAWKGFFVVDALHLIGFGILFVVLLHILGRKVFTNFNPLFLIAAILFFILMPLTASVKWTNYMHIAFANYFTREFGSFFPFIPYAGYVLIGASFGQILGKNDGIHLENKFIMKIAFLALLSLIVSYVILYLKVKASYNGIFEVLNRTGYVLLIATILMFVTKKVTKIHWLIKAIGKHTLLIYVVHLILLYGCIWFPGIYNLFRNSFTPAESIIAAILMETLMIGMIYIIEKRQVVKKSIITVNS